MLCLLQPSCRALSVSGTLGSLETHLASSRGTLCLTCTVPATPAGNERHCDGFAFSLKTLGKQLVFNVQRKLAMLELECWGADVL